MTMKTKPLSLDKQIAAEQQRYFVKVYGWMCLAMIITGFVAKYTASSQAILDIIFKGRWLFFVLVIIQFAAVIVMGRVINRISANIATVIFVVYSVLFGVTFSCIFVVYTEESIAPTFMVTAVTFGVMSLFGYATKTDLTRRNNFLLMLAIALAAASFTNLMMDSSLLYWITTVIGVLTFVGLTAYDTQKIKNLNVIGNEGSDDDRKEAIMGALTLYLDFITLFFFILGIFGKRKQNNPESTSW
jgi:uncharacterized protein